MLDVQIEVRRGDVAEAVAEAAAEHGADLIVMSSHGYSGFTRWLLGSVAEKALRIAPCPVLVVRSPEPLRHMLIPLDGSPLSEVARSMRQNKLGCLPVVVDENRLVGIITEADFVKLSEQFLAQA